MLVLTAFLAIGVLCVAFLVYFLFFLTFEDQMRARGDARRFAIRRPDMPFHPPSANAVHGLTLSYSNPGFIRRGDGAQASAVQLLRKSPHMKKEA